VLGCVILYADTITDSMQSAMDEIARRRTIQIAYNTEHHIIPRTIIKPVRSKIVEKEDPIVDFIHRLGSLGEPDTFCIFGKTGVRTSKSFHQ
jgi:excinuclease UvrABC helicase subunit UvrB